MATKPDRLAQEIADVLHDPEALALYQSFTRKYSEAFLRRLLMRVLSVPDHKIRRTVALYSLFSSASMNAAETTTVAAISLGTRSIGFAVLKSGDLLDWKVQSFKGSWSMRKCNLISGVIAAQMRRFAPDALMLKLPAEPRPSKGMRKLIHALEKLAEKQDIPVCYCTLENLKQHFVCDNKQMLCADVAKRFPELHHDYKKESGNRNPYYTKAFEAVAAAVICAQNSCK